MRFHSSRSSSGKGYPPHRLQMRLRVRKHSSIGPCGPTAFVLCRLVFVCGSAINNDCNRRVWSVRKSLAVVAAAHKVLIGLGCMYVCMMHACVRCVHAPVYTHKKGIRINVLCGKCMRVNDDDGNDARDDTMPYVCVCVCVCYVCAYLRRWSVLWCIIICGNMSARVCALCT